MLKANQFITPVPVYKTKYYWNDNTQIICSLTLLTLMACQEVCKKL